MVSIFQEHVGYCDMVANGLDMLGFTRLGSTNDDAAMSGYSVTPGTVTLVPSSLGIPFGVTTLPALCEAREHVAAMPTAL